MPAPKRCLHALPLRLPFLKDPAVNQVLTSFLTAGGTLAVSEGAKYLFSLSRTKADRATQREANADGATKTGVDALKDALAAQEKVFAAQIAAQEKALADLGVKLDKDRISREEAERNVASLGVAVAALADRIEELNRDLADQPQLKAENQRLRRQVAELQKQVAGLKARIADLELTREERITMEAESLKTEIVKSEVVKTEILRTLDPTS